jgi:predicted house-cleaning NTP pyrophosphatase (Maf/HAM1 superfamily)
VGKPADAEDPAACCASCAAAPTRSITALAVRPPHSGELLEDLCCTDVPMREYTEAEIEAYLATATRLTKPARTPSNIRLSAG